MSKDKELWKQQERRNTLHTKLLPQTSGGFLNRKKFFINLFYRSLFLVSNPFVEDWLSIDRSEGAALRGMKPRSRSRLSTNGLALGSPGTCHVWLARGLPPFRLCRVSQEEGLSTPDPGPGTCWAAPLGTVCWQGLQGTSYPRPTEGKHYPVTRGKQGHYKKRSYRPISLMNTNVILNKLPANIIQQHGWGRYLQPR